jgi:hypothetical protein
VRGERRDVRGERRLVIRRAFGPTEERRTPDADRTMATAVCGGATRAASDEFCSLVKIKSVAGQSPLPEGTPVCVRLYRTRQPPDRYRRRQTQNADRTTGRHPCLCQTMSDPAAAGWLAKTRRRLQWLELGTVRSDLAFLQTLPHLDAAHEENRGDHQAL